MSRRSLVLLALGILGLFGVASHFLSQKSLTVNYRDAREVVVYKAGTLDSGKGGKPVAKIASSGQVVKLRGGAYTIHYVGDAGFNSRYVSFDLTKKQQSITITPALSESRLETIRKAEFAAINKAISEQYPAIGLYEIQPGRLYKAGEWYGTVLKYKGADFYNSDSLRIVLNKQAGIWVVSTAPPAISLSKLIYPDVPEDILRDVNTL